METTEIVEVVEVNNTFDEIKTAAGKAAITAITTVLVTALANVLISKSVKKIAERNNTTEVADKKTEK